MRRIKIPIINEDLAYLCGVLAGDGSINIRENKYDYEIKCVGNPRDEKEFYKKIICTLFKKLFNVELKSKQFDKKTTYGIRIWSKELVMFLIQRIGLPSGKKYSKLKIPEIFLTNKNLTRSFISGLFDTDFCVSINKMNNYPRIRGVSKSEKFISEIRDFLEKDGFRVTKGTIKYFDKRIQKIIITYGICLCGHRQLEKWLEKIGTRHPKHIKKIKIARGGVPFKNT